MFGARDHNSLHFPKHRKSIQFKIDCDTNFRLFKKKRVCGEPLDIRLLLVLGGSLFLENGSGG